MNIWEGQKIRLRAVLPEDWEKFRENDQDSEIARAADAIYFPRSEARTRAWAEEQATRAADGDNMRLSIETLDGEFVGTINAFFCDRRNGNFKYGLAIFRPYQRLGYASEAVKIFLRYYFDELRYEKVTANVFGFNEPSMRLHEHLGFTQEGRLRNMVYTDGQYYDEYIYGLLKSEFER